MTPQNQVRDETPPKFDAVADHSTPTRSASLAARMEPFDSFWEGPEDVDAGYSSFGQFYRVNYLGHVPKNKTSRILVVSCGPGYFVSMLVDEGYTAVVGVDSDADKIGHAQKRGIDCRVERAFEFLESSPDQYDAIVCEQELNHLTKDEMIEFLHICRQRLRPDGVLLVHSLNGANPITGAEALAQNFDHFNTMTEYSLRQVLEHSGFKNTRIIPLKLYVFHRNPLNYVAMAWAFANDLLFRANFKLYGKSNKIFTKKIAAVAQRP